MSDIDDVTPEVPSPPKPSRSRAKSEDTVVVDAAALAKAVSKPTDGEDAAGQKATRTRKPASAGQDEEPFVIGDIDAPEVDVPLAAAQPLAQPPAPASQTWDWDADEDFSYSPGVMVTTVATEPVPDSTAPSALDAETGLYQALGEEDPAEFDTFAAEQAARDRALGKVTPQAEEGVPAPVVPAAPVERWPASFGLLVLRVVTAILVGILGVQHLTGMAAFADTWTQTVLPAGPTIAAVIAVAEVAVSVLLLFGMLVRAAGAVVFLISAATLAFVLWGADNPFQPGVVGFAGDLELLLVAVGLLLLLIGGGAWGIDGALHRSYAERRAQRA